MGRERLFWHKNNHSVNTHQENSHPTRKLFCPAGIVDFYEKSPVRTALQKG